jgi:hypothetical protein
MIEYINNRNNINNLNNNLIQSHSYVIQTNMNKMNNKISY